MNHRDPSAAMERPSEETKGLMLPATIADAIEDSYGIIAKAERQMPGFEKRLSETTRGLYDDTKDCSVSVVMTAMLHKRVIMDRAAQGIPSSEADNGRLPPATLQSRLLNFSALMHDGLHEILPSDEDVPALTPEEKLAYITQRAAPSSYAIRASKELRTSLEGSTRSDGEFQILACHSAAMLSAKESTYRRVQASFKEAHNRLEEIAPNSETTRFEMIERPEHFHEYVATLDNPQALNTHYLALLLRAFIAQLDTDSFKNKDELEDALRSRRSALLRYAKNAAFDPAFVAAFRHAQDEVLGPSLEKTEPTLDWEVLPYGEVTTFAREIVKSASGENSKATIDLERLQILENIRLWWGEDMSYYQKGVHKNRKIIKDGDKAAPDEYILLILQETDDDGTVICEHAVAESPIAGPNALHIQRYDVNHWDWKELMQHPKQDIYAMGARAVKHTAPEGDDMISSVTEKVKYLLSCPAEDFGSVEFKGRKSDGSLRTRLARTALQAMTLSQ